MTNEQHGRQFRLELAVIGAARTFVHELQKQKPTKALRASRTKLEIAVEELETHERACLPKVARHG